MKHLIGAILLLVLNNACFSQHFTYNQGGTETKNYYVELPYETMNGKMFVVVEIGGKKHKFLFDTGAPVAINPQLADSLNMPVVLKQNVKDVTGKHDSTSVVKLSGLKLGGLSFNNVPALTLFPAIYKCWGIDGVIGSNLLRNSIVAIQNDKHLIILTDQPDKLSLIRSHSVPMITDKDQQSNPLIKILLNGNIPVTLGFDTGDNGFFRLSEELMKQHDDDVYKLLAKGYGASTFGAYGLQDNADKYLVKIPLLNMGDATFTNVITVTNKGGIPGIGYKLLTYGNVTLDFIHHKFYFDPKQKMNDLEEKQWPFQPTIAGDKLVVGVIWDKAINLIKPGEQIIAINDKSYRQIDICDIINSPSPLVGQTTAAITLMDEKGNIRTIQITKE